MQARVEGDEQVGHDSGRSGRSAASILRDLWTSCIEETVKMKFALDQGDFPLRVRPDSLPVPLAPLKGSHVTMTLDMTIQELYEEFDFLGDWEDRCDFLIDLGFELPQLPEEAKVEENRVQGCQSNVWLVSELNEAANPSVIQFVANSDAMIVNGLIAVLNAVYNKKTPQEILQTDIEAIFKRLELDRHLSSQRRNGLFGMVTRIREFAMVCVAKELAAQDALTKS